MADDIDVLAVSMDRGCEINQIPRKMEVKI